MEGKSLETEVEKRKWPSWLKWVIRIVLVYLTTLAIILAFTIIVVLITFSFIVIDGFSDSTSLGAYSERYLVPISEFMWNLFTWLIPGL